MLCENTLEVGRGKKSLIFLQSDLARILYLLRRLYLHLARHQDSRTDQQPHNEQY